jgi:hypothetical protein
VRHEIRREDRLALALRFWCGDVAMKVVDRGSLIGLADAVGKDVMVFVPFRNLVNPGPEDYAERNDLYRKRELCSSLICNWKHVCHRPELKHESSTEWASMSYLD